MNQIAFLWNGISIYWSGIVIMLACLAAILAALGLRSMQGTGVADMAVMIPIAMVLSFLIARILHWYCYYRQYTSLMQALTDYSVGAFSLTGAFAGVLIAAAIVKATGLSDSLGSLLDAVAPAAALGIGAGRFSAVFNSYDRGSVIFEEEMLHGLPFSTEVADSFGATEWHSAVFFWEGITALVIAVILLAVFLSGLRHPGRYSDGKVCWLFLMLYGTAEIMLDSMRYDSAFLRSNGFVSLVQILGLLILILELVIFSARRIRGTGFHICFPALWFLFLCGAGVAGFSEYYVQRHGNLYIFSYTLMGIGLAACLAALLPFWAWEGQERKHTAARLRK